MTNLLCPRCGYQTDRVFLFKAHVNRTRVCPALLANCSLEELRKQYTNEREKEHACELCKKAFGSKSGLYKHKQTCIGVNRNDLVQTLAIQEIAKTLVEIKEILLSQRDIAVFNQMTVPNVSVPITPSYISEEPSSSAQSNICVKIKDFGQEEILHLLHNENLMKLIFQQNEVGLLKFIDLIWFDENHGKNKNIKIKDKDSAEYYQYQKWTPVKTNSLVHTIVDYIGCYLQQSLEYSAFLSEGFLNAYMEKIGVHLEWDLSHGEWEYETEQESDEATKRKLLQAVKLHLLKKIN